MNTPVTFEIAKLLKEKGFDELCDKKYIAQCLWQSPNSREQYKNSEIHQNSSDVAAPTIAEVIMWLYEKHGIWVVVLPKQKDKGLFWGVFYSEINKQEFSKSLGSNFSSPTEAYSEAIKHTLNNLI